MSKDNYEPMRKMIIKTSDVFFKKKKGSINKTIGYLDGFEIEKIKWKNRRDAYRISGYKEVFGYLYPGMGFYDAINNRFYKLEEMKDVILGDYELKRIK